MTLELLAYVIASFFALVFIFRGIDRFVYERITLPLQRILYALERREQEIEVEIPKPRKLK